MSQVFAQQTAATPEPPALEYFFTYSVDFNMPFVTGEGPTGTRWIYPVRSGKFTGPKINGK